MTQTGTLTEDGPENGETRDDCQSKRDGVVGIQRDGEGGLKIPNPGCRHSFWHLVSS